MAYCGLMLSDEFLYASDLRPRHLSICFHHSASAFLSGCTDSARHSRTMSSSTCAQSPMIATSALTFLLIDDGSMSTWIFFEFGENESSRPVMRSSKRAPMQLLTS